MHQLSSFALSPFIPYPPWRERRKALLSPSTDPFHPEAAPAICEVTDCWVLLLDFSAGILFEVLLPSADQKASESII